MKRMRWNGPGFDPKAPAIPLQQPVMGHLVREPPLYAPFHPQGMVYANHPPVPTLGEKGMMNYVPVQYNFPYYLPHAPLPMTHEYPSPWPHCRMNVFPTSSRVHPQLPVVACLVPPPPEVPIFNPIVYSNNCDVGTRDLEYISESEFQFLNAHSGNTLTIPRPSPPHIAPSPHDLIPPLVTAHPSPGEQVIPKRVIPRNSPSSIFESQVGVKSNNDKLFVIGFAWDAQPFDEEFVGDAWIKPKQVQPPTPPSSM